MTSYFDSIRDLTERASNDEMFESVLHEVFPIVARTVKSKDYTLKHWFRQEYDSSVPEGNIDINDWNEYFDEVHDLDHMTDQDPNKRQMREMNKTSEKVNDPLYCPTCNTNPDFEEIWAGAYQCKNCNTVIDEDGNILEEGEEPSPNTEDDLFDDEKEAEEE